MKTWSYTAITKIAEQEIIYFMEKNKTVDSDFERWMYINMANGAFSFWCVLTADRQRDGDHKRLEALTKTDPPPVS